MTELVVPKPRTHDDNQVMWYEKYPNLSSSNFLYENSGNKENAPSPYAEIRNDDGDIIGIKGLYGMQHTYKIVGYTENPPFQPDGYHAVAIMFEHCMSYENLWFHYRSGKDIDMRTLPQSYYGNLTEQQFEYEQKFRTSDIDDDDDDEADAN